MNDLASLFPAGDFEFRMTMRRGDPAAFFKPQDATGELRRERARWVDDSPTRYAAMLAGYESLLREASVLGRTWGLGIVNDTVALARTWEPDVLLLSPDEAGVFTLRGGALCFPTGWALAEKIGRPLHEIHAPVPGLNPSIGSAIDRFLRSLKPSTAFLRDNWGIAASDELNLHPARGIPRPMLPVVLRDLWLRVEHQALVALPSGAGIIFGIRLSLYRLDEVRADPVVAAHLARALQTMSAELLRYKGLLDVRDALIAALA